MPGLNNRRVAGAAVFTARELLRLILRLEEIQNRVAIALVVVVGFGDGFCSVFAVTIRSLQHPRSVRLVAPV